MMSTVSFMTTPVDAKTTGLGATQETAKCSTWFSLWSCLPLFVGCNYSNPVKLLKPPLKYRHGWLHPTPFMLMWLTIHARNSALVLVSSVCKRSPRWVYSTYSTRNINTGFSYWPAQQVYCDTIFWHVDTCPIPLFLFLFYYTFDVCIIIVSLCLIHFISCTCGY